MKVNLQVEVPHAEFLELNRNKQEEILEQLGYTLMGIVEHEQGATVYAADKYGRVHTMYIGKLYAEAM